MKVKYKFFSKTVGCIMAVLSVVLGFSSCDDEFTTDKSGFNLYYTSMTDIAPSMTGVIASPTYNGAVPSDFKITEMNYSSTNDNGEETREAYTGDCFSIVSETGEIMINSTADMKTGKYYLSVSCVAAGRTYTYKDAVVVNFLKAVPEGITVKPDFLEVKLADVTTDSEVEFPTAQVSVENTDEYISILGYKISNVRRVASDDSETYIDNTKVKLFSVSETGVVSINKVTEDDAKAAVEAGTYKIDLKLTTAASPSLPEEEGLFVNALTVNLSAAPTAISYKEGFIETGVDGDASRPRGAFASSKPLVAGSTNGATYEITAIKKSSGGTFTDASEAEKAFFSIDAATGIVSVPNTHTFVLDDVYKVSVKVTNADGSYTGEDALTLTVVEWVDPLTAFDYPELSVKQGMKCESREPIILDSRGAEFSLEGLSEEYEDYVSIDKTTGVVTVEKYNTMPVGNFEIAVKAKNFKSEATGKLVIKVEDNPNYFTYISYGNNLVDDQTPGSIYDNQYRFRTLEELNSSSLTPKTDIKEGRKVKWSMAIKHQSQGIKIDSNTGVITSNVSQKDFTGKVFPIMFVTVTVGDDNEAFTRTVPVFFNYSQPLNDVTIEYTPFVFRVNPKRGGASQTPIVKVNDIAPDMSKFYVDTYNTMSYFNLNGVRSDGDGTPLEDGRVDPKNASDRNPFLQHLWDKYGQGNYNASFPLQYFDGEKIRPNLQEQLSYINNAQGDNKLSLVVNPKKWYDDGWADGVFICKLRFTTNATFPIPQNSSNSNFYMAIWFDKDYKSEK